MKGLQLKGPFPFEGLVKPYGQKAIGSSYETLFYGELKDSMTKGSHTFLFERLGELVRPWPQPPHMQHYTMESQAMLCQKGHRLLHLKR